MEKVEFLPNGQWKLEKSKKESPFTFEHAYSDSHRNEEGFVGSKDATSLEETSSGSWPSRTHWFKVNHKEHGDMGMIPVTTDQFPGDDFIDYGTWGYTRVGDKLSPPSKDDKMHEFHTKKLHSNMETHGLKYEDISNHFINHMSNIKPDELHGNVKSKPLEFASRDKNTKLQ